MRDRERRYIILVCHALYEVKHRNTDSDKAGLDVNCGAVKD